MAYNYFPTGYQPVYYPTQNNAFPTQMNVATQNSALNSVLPMQSGIIWVQGEAGAKSYLVAPNTTVQLWDSESQTIYLKSADASGMPSMKVLDYTIREPQNGVQTHTVGDSANYVTKADFGAIKEEIGAIKKRIDEMEVAKNEPVVSANE